MKKQTINCATYLLAIAGFKQCRPFLEWIIPALHLKKEEAQIVLDFTNSNPAGPHAKADKEKRIDMYFKLRSVRIGRKGPFSKWQTKEQMLSVLEERKRQAAKNRAESYRQRYPITVSLDS